MKMEKITKVEKDSGLPHKHIHNVEHVSKTYEGAGHKPAHENYKQHAGGHMLHHEYVKKICNGGKV